MKAFFFWRREFSHTVRSPHSSLDSKGIRNRSPHWLISPGLLAAMSLLMSAPRVVAVKASYLQKRDSLIGAVDSHELLSADSTHGLLPSSLSRDSTLPQLTYVDESRCIGCRYCAEIARSTFRMEAEFGAARVFQQSGDTADVIAEAIDCCPVDCIHAVSFNELEVLERHRRGLLAGGGMAAAQGAGKLAARAEGRDTANWRSPLRDGVSRDRSRLDEPPSSAGEESALSGGGAAAAESIDDEALAAVELGWEAFASLFPEEEDI